eukprot:25681-Chlamydomonas_euryale.AAC.2
MDVQVTAACSPRNSQSVPASAPRTSRASLSLTFTSAAASARPRRARSREAPHPAPVWGPQPRDAPHLLDIPDAPHPAALCVTRHPTCAARCTTGRPARQLRVPASLPAPTSIGRANAEDTAGGAATAAASRGATFQGLGRRNRAGHAATARCYGRDPSARSACAPRSHRRQLRRPAETCAPCAARVPPPPKRAHLLRPVLRPRPEAGDACRTAGRQTGELQRQCSAPPR